MEVLVVTGGDKERIIERLHVLLDDRSEEISGFRVFSNSEEIDIREAIVPVQLSTNEEMLAMDRSERTKKMIVLVIGSGVFMSRSLPALALSAGSLPSPELRVADYRHLEQEERNDRNRQWKVNLRSASCKGRLNVNKKR